MNVERIENVATLLAKNTLVWERHFPVEPEKLWSAIATKDGLSHWFMSIKSEIEEGGRFSFEGGWDGTITQVRPQRFIQFTPDESDQAYLRFEIKKVEGGCLFRLVDKMGPKADPVVIFDQDVPEHLKYQPGGTGTHWSGAISGYHGFVDGLERYITGKKIDFDYNVMNKKYMSLQDEWLASGKYLE